MTEAVNHIRSRVFLVPRVLVLYDNKKHTSVTLDILVPNLPKFLMHWKDSGMGIDLKTYNSVLHEFRNWNKW